MNIAHALEELDLGFAQTFRNLTVVPLVRRSRASGEDEAPPYLTLDEAIARELLFIRELPGAASVPELQAENRGNLPVLLVDGDQLVGAKQNRIINLTILVPPGKTIVDISADVSRCRSRRDRLHRQRRRDWRSVGGGGKARACDGVPEKLRQRRQPCL